MDSLGPSYNYHHPPGGGSTNQGALSYTRELPSCPSRAYCRKVIFPRSLSLAFCAGLYAVHTSIRLYSYRVGAVLRLVPSAISRLPLPLALSFFLGYCPALPLSGPVRPSSLFSTPCLLILRFLWPYQCPPSVRLVLAAPLHCATPPKILCRIGPRLWAVS